MANPPTWSNVKLICDFEGATTTTAWDLSPSRHALTFAGSAVNSTTQKQHGLTSLSPAASSSWVQCTDTLTDFNFGSGQFTIECWVYCTGTMAATTNGAVTQFSGASNLGWFLGMLSGVLSFYYSTTGVDNPNIGAAWTPTLSTWHHIAVDRDASNVLRLYLNGAVHASATVASTFFNSTDNLRMGSDGNGSRNWIGFVDSVRIVKGEAVYGGAFTPVTTFYPLSNPVDSHSFNNTRIYSAIPTASVRGMMSTLNNYSGGPVKSISGTVQEEGVNVARLVRVYRRTTGELLGSATSDAGTGAFSISVNGVVDYCFVVAFDDLTLSPDYNAQIYDLVLGV